MKREKEIEHVTLVGSVVNLLLVGLKGVAGIAGNSAAMEANAWHHRSDALSSIGAAIGIGGAIFLGNRLDGSLTLAEAHEKATEVERRIKAQFGQNSHIIVHMEPRK